MNDLVDYNERLNRSINAASRELESEEEKIINLGHGIVKGACGHQIRRCTCPQHQQLEVSVGVRCRTCEGVGSLRKSAASNGAIVDKRLAQLAQDGQRQVTLHGVETPATQNDVISRVRLGSIDTVRADYAQADAIKTACSSVTGLSGTTESHRQPGVIAETFLTFPQRKQILDAEIAGPSSLLRSTPDITKHSSQMPVNSALALGIIPRGPLKSASSAGVAVSGVASSVMRVGGEVRKGVQQVTLAAHLLAGGLQPHLKSAFFSCDSSVSQGVTGVGGYQSRRMPGAPHVEGAVGVGYAASDVVGSFSQLKSASHDFEPGRPIGRVFSGAGSAQVFTTLTCSEITGMKLPYMDGKLLRKGARRNLYLTHKPDYRPSLKQIQAGNYRKGHVNWSGLDITVENPKGGVRRGVDANGVAWESRMPCPYGYIRSAAGGESGKRVRPIGKDGDHIDVFLGDNRDSQLVVVVDQYFGRDYDESKFILGCDTVTQATQLYMAAYHDGWKLGPVSTCTLPQLKDWLKHGQLGKPFKGQQVKAARLGWL